MCGTAWRNCPNLLGRNFSTSSLVATCTSKTSMASRIRLSGGLLSLAFLNPNTFCVFFAPRHQPPAPSRGGGIAPVRKASLSRRDPSYSPRTNFRASKSSLRNATSIRERPGSTRRVINRTLESRPCKSTRVPGRYCTVRELNILK